MNENERDERVAEPFDQTNGVVEGLDGDSDGTEASDDTSEAEREGAPDAPRDLPPAANLATGV